MERGDKVTAKVAVNVRKSTLIPLVAEYVMPERQDVDVLFTFDGAGLKGRRNPEKMLYYDDRIQPPEDASAGRGKLRICEPFVPMGEMFDQAKLAGGAHVPVPQLPPDEVLSRTKRALRQERRQAQQLASDS